MFGLCDGSHMPIYAHGLKKSTDQMSNCGNVCRNGEEIGHFCLISWFCLVGLLCKCDRPTGDSECGTGPVLKLWLLWDFPLSAPHPFSSLKPVDSSNISTQQSRWGSSVAWFICGFPLVRALGDSAIHVFILSSAPPSPSPSPTCPGSVKGKGF